MGGEGGRAGGKNIRKVFTGGEGGVFRNFSFGRGEGHILLFVRERQFCGGGGGVGGGGGGRWSYNFEAKIKIA